MSNCRYVQSLFTPAKHVDRSYTTSGCLAFGAAVRALCSAVLGFGLRGDMHALGGAIGVRVLLLARLVTSAAVASPCGAHAV